MSGNRDVCGTNKFLQNMKNKDKKLKTSLGNIHSDLMTLQEELKKKTEKNCKKTLERCLGKFRASGL